MPKDFDSYLEYLTATGADKSKISAAREVFQDFSMWAASGSLPELQIAEARLAATFGTDRDGYVTIPDLHAVTAGLRKTLVRWAMAGLGFREERPRIDGVRVRVWVRGVNAQFVPRLTVQAQPGAPACPVPLP